MARPRNAFRSVTMSLRIPEPVAIVLARRAAEEGVSRNALAAKSLASLAVTGEARWPSEALPAEEEKP